MRLFIERATSSKNDFAVTRQNAPVLAAVCHRLDGIPLAIELAAARVRSLSVEEIDSKLDNRFRLLKGGSKVALPRHQTLQALIDWSYDLLSEPERLLLCRLSVFAGGWTLSATESVCTGESAAGAAIEEWEVLDLLTSLVDKSLVIADTQGSATRYRLLETVRQYARERLEAIGETETVRARHRDYFLGVAEETAIEQGQWLATLEAEHDNLRQAMSFCLEDVAGAEAGLRMGAALQRFWEVRGHWREGRAFLAAALQRADGIQSRHVRAGTLLVAGRLAYLQGDYTTARTWSEEGLAIYRELGDRWGIAWSLSNLGLAATDQGDYARARVLIEGSLAIYRELGDKQDVAWSLSNLGRVASRQGDYTEARALYAESLVFFRELDNKRGIAISLGNMGDVASRQGDYTAARVLIEDSLAISRELGNKQDVAWSLNSLGRVASRQGDYIAARVVFEGSLGLFRELDNKRGIAWSLNAFAQLAHGLQHHQRAACLWGGAMALHEQIGAPRTPAEQAEYELQTEQSRTDLGEAAFDAAFAEGKAMTIEQAIEYALAPPRE